MRQVSLNSESRTLIPNCRIAEGFFDRFLGLMGKSKISEDEAVCFPNCNSIHTFFMRFPIDVILVSATGEVVEVVDSMSAWRLMLPKRGVKHVIEMSAMRSKSLGIQSGQKLQCEGVWD